MALFTTFGLYVSKKRMLVWLLYSFFGVRGDLVSAWVGGWTYHCLCSFLFFETGLADGGLMMMLVFEWNLLGMDS